MASNKYKRSPSGPENSLLLETVITHPGGLSVATAAFTYPKMRYTDTFVTTLDDPLAGADSQYINWAYMSGSTASPVPVVAMMSFQGIGAATRSVRICVQRNLQR